MPKISDILFTKMPNFVQLSEKFVWANTAAAANTAVWAKTADCTQYCSPQPLHRSVAIAAANTAGCGQYCGRRPILRALLQVAASNANCGTSGRNGLTSGLIYGLGGR